MARPRRRPENDFQRSVLDLAALYRWDAWHNPDSRKTRAGWIDLTLLGHGRALFAELKSSTGRATAEQRLVLDQLEDAGCEVALWRPVHLPLIARALGPQQERLTPWRGER